MHAYADSAVHRWLRTYKKTHQDLLSADPNFARWLDEEYVPIAGGWQY